METRRNTGERIKRNDGDLVVEGVLLMAGVYHPQVLETQVLNGSVQDSELCAMRTGRAGVGLP
jgi:hypothetical protein